MEILVFEQNKQQILCMVQVGHTISNGLVSW
nr:MAG TPA: hypothetical protein [Caudoviricetes sp.]DAU07005.1 MAG TPA: hypothetical protein [Caudoviricetes sp.]DAU41381.1 MAG TPA: hypothetical protein [Bacteriophage sp.]DAX10781.1 MAG TPA: hypothetical protein [Bacteriophage sp.]